jgi:hypothetical protein
MIEKSLVLGVLQHILPLGLAIDLALVAFASATL